MDTPVQGVMTRSKMRQSMTPPAKSFQDFLNAADPMLRREAQVFGTPMSVMRTALGDVTNESPFGSIDFSLSSTSKQSAGMSTKGVRSARRIPASTSRGTIASLDGDDVAGGTCEAEAGEDALRSEVSRIMAGLPETVETPVLTRKKSFHQKGEASASQQGKEGEERESTSAQDLAPALLLIPASPVPLGTNVKGRERAQDPIFVSPSTLLAPTPVNTPSSSVDGPLAVMKPCQLAEAIKACASMPGSPVRLKGPAPTPVSSPAPAAASGRKLPPGFSASKPPVHRSSKLTPRRNTLRRSSVIPALRIATPIGKTPPPRAARRDEQELGYDPAHLLQAIAAVESEEFLFSVASSPDRPTRVLSFDDPPASLPSTPAFSLFKFKEDCRRERGATGRKGANEVPPSPAWSLDVNVSSPGSALAKGLGSKMGPTAEEEEGTVGECEEGGEYEEEGEDELCEAVSELSVSGRCMPLRGLPAPAGTHIRFEDEEEPERTHIRFEEEEDA